MKKLVSIILGFGFSLTLLATVNPDSLSTTDSSNERVGQFSIMYPLGTDGWQTKEHSYRSSINLISGVNAGIDGFEWSGFSSITRGDVRGFQASGFSNVVSGNFIGYQTAGFMNVNKGNLKGVQTAGFLNVNLQEAKGTQITGFMNLNGAKFKGMQIAGFMNLVNHSINGGQISGFGSIATKNVNGLQCSGFMNVADTVDLQIAGFINVARKVNKTQIGFINICDSTEGTPIGFLSIVRNGYRALEIEANDIIFLNINGKLGVDKFYNIFTVGATPKNNKIFWTFGYGMGGQVFQREKLSMNIDFTSGQVNEGSWWTQRMNLLNQLKINFAVDTKTGIKIYGGPNIKYLIQETTDQFGQPIAVTRLSKLDVFNLTDNYFKHSIVIGANAGVRF